MAEPLGLDGFVGLLEALLDSGEVPGINRLELVAVDRVDNRTLGVKVAAERFLIEVKVVDERPDPIIDLLNPQPRSSPGR